MLLVGWALLEGIGAALVLAATAALISSTYVGDRRAFAFGFWAAIARPLPLSARSSVASSRRF